MAPLGNSRTLLCQQLRRDEHMRVHRYERAACLAAASRCLPAKSFIQGRQRTIAKAEVTAWRHRFRHSIKYGSNGSEPSKHKTSADEGLRDAAWSSLVRWVQHEGGYMSAVGASFLDIGLIRYVIQGHTHLRLDQV